MQNRISFLNDAFLSHDKAFIHIDDRGFQFGDGVYEVILFTNNKLIDFEPHFTRLERSLQEISINNPYKKPELEKIILELFTRNNLLEGSVYLQISRGVAPRAQGFIKNISPTIVINVSPLKISVEEHLKSIIQSSGKIADEEIHNYQAITHEDIRWLRCDIKSLNLLAATMIKQKAIEASAAEVILIRDGFVTEGSFSNVFIVDKNNKLITRNADNLILQGITRNRILELAKAKSIEIEERNFSYQELIDAKEVFLTSSTLLIRPIVKVDDALIGDGSVGFVAKELAMKYLEFMGIFY